MLNDISDKTISKPAIPCNAFGTRGFGVKKASAFISPVYRPIVLEEKYKYINNL